MSNWARAVQHWQEDQEGVGGSFSQMGDPYVVHSWGETRNAAWRKRGWDENVYHTVPLVQRKESPIPIPLEISPLQ